MRRRLALATAIVLMPLAGGAPAGEPPAASAPAAGGIATLAWLSGCWRGSEGEECWLEPRAGTMLGVSRGAGDGGRAPSYEFLRIVEEDGGLVYQASPGGRCPPTPFRAVEVGARRVAFANPAHDFPQRITYWLEGDTLHARVEAEQDGQTRGFELVWTRGSWEGG
jgi:hypothetical protein